MWVTKLLISPVKKRIFCPKTTKFGPKLAFLVDMGLAMQVFLVPCWWVSWWLWRAGYISQDTYLLYLFEKAFCNYIFTMVEVLALGTFERVVEFEPDSSEERANIRHKQTEL